jgi:hypothetical protein
MSAYTYNTPTFNNDAISGSLTQSGGPIDVSGTFKCCSYSNSNKGGWADAGDYLKFVETASFVVDLMAFAYRENANQSKIVRKSF